VPSAPAIYTFGIRTRDAAGNWSHTSLRLYDNLTAATYPTAPPAPTALQRLEYFINDDPGLGNGTPISFTSSTNVADLNVSIDLTSVALGDHRLYIRSRNNPYSLTTIVPFTKGSALPVTWQYVRGEMRTDGAWLWWGTANETNTKHFVVEHSTDGSSFEALGTVVAAGNSNSSKQYQYVHTQPAAGLHYYRIKQVDKDGAFTYSAILLLQAQSLGADASIVPTVVASKFTLHLSKVYSQSLPYSIVSSAGAIIMQGKIAAGANQASVQVGHLPQGMYRLLLLAPEGRRTFNFLKQ
jgi:hypothetical protein